MNYADVLSSVRKCLLSDSSLTQIVSDRVWVGHADNVINKPCVIISLRSPGKADLSHAHRRVQVNISCFSATSMEDAFTLQSAVEGALRNAYKNIELEPIIYISADCPFQLPAEKGYLLTQNFFGIAKEAS